MTASTSGLVLAAIGGAAAATLVLAAGRALAGGGAVRRGLHHYRAAFPWTLWVDPQGRRLLRQPALAAAMIAALGVGVGGGIAGFAIGAAAGALLGWQLCQLAERRTERRFQDQLPDAARRLADGVRAGLALPEAIAGVANDAPMPLQAVLRSLLRAHELGKPLAAAARDVQQRSGNRDFALVTEAVVVCLERGGPLPAVLDRIAAAIQELAALRRRIESATSGAVLAMRVMAVTPVFALFLLYLADPGRVGLLFHTVPGLVVVTLAIVLVGCAMRWSRSIIRQYI